MGSVEGPGAPYDRRDESGALLAVALTMGRGFVLQRIGPTLGEWHYVVEHERPGVEVGQAVVDGLAADVAGWLVAGYSCAVLVA